MSSVPHGPRRSRASRLVVLAIGFAVPWLGIVVFSWLQEIRLRGLAFRARAELETLTCALDMYRIDYGQYPATQPGLTALRGYIDDKALTDPWGHPVLYDATINPPIV